MNWESENKKTVRKQGAGLTRQQSLAARPLRNTAVGVKKMENGDIELTVPRRRDWLGKLLALLFYIPKERRVLLEGIGSQVWELCDGEHSVAQMIGWLAEKHKLDPREAELSLVQYLRTLGKRKLIAFAVPRNGQ
jgi:hypothetical protein